MSSQDDPRHNGDDWANSWLTPEDVRSRPQIFPFIVDSRHNAETLAILIQARNKQTRRERKTRALTLAALVLAMALGILGLLTSSPMPGIG